MIISVISLVVTIGVIRWQRNRGSPFQKNIVRILLLVEVAGLLASTVSLAQTRFLPVQSVERPEAGGSGKEKEFFVRYRGKRIKVTEKVSERKLTGKEIQRYFRKAEKEIADTLPGHNRDLGHVAYDLQPKTSYADGWVTAAWDFSEEGEGEYSEEKLISSRGAVQNETLEKKRLMIARAELICQDTTEYFELPVTVIPAELHTKEGLSRVVRDAFARENKKNPEKKRLKLPASLNGERLTWNEKGGSGGRELSLLGMAAAFALVLGGIAEKKRQKEDYLEALRNDYPGILNMLFLYVQSGITPRGSIQRITASYAYRRKRGTERKRPGYELMIRILREMESGIGERDAYEHLGKYAGEQSFRKLSLLLTQNLKKGTGDLLIHLERESREIQESQKNKVRAEGEKITTKLLLPMMILMSVIMVILIFPAIYGIQSGTF